MTEPWERRAVSAEINGRRVNLVVVKREGEPKRMVREADPREA